MTDVKNIVVLGAGVVGLSTALKIQERPGYKVTIVAEYLPTDEKNVKYTSHWAGAQHVSFATLDDFRHPIDAETFWEMWEMSKEGGEAESCFLRIQQTELFAYERQSPSPLGHMPNFRTLRKDELPADAIAGETFEALTIDVPLYLNFLLTKFLARGGRVVRGAVSHLAQLAEHGALPYLPAAERKYLADTGAGSRPDAIVVCAGLGARYLGGLEDTAVHPIRGQTVLIRAPWVTTGRTLSMEGCWTYIIPRGKSGIVILGGTIIADDWYPQPRPETARDIIERNLRLMPELVPPHLRKNRNMPTVEDVLPLIVEEGCGFRPGRTGGLRIEAGAPIPAGPGSKERVPVIYNYGHAGSGYIASFGSANRVVTLLDKAVGRPRAAL